MAQSGLKYDGSQSLAINFVDILLPCLLVLFWVGDIEVLTELREGQVIGLLGLFITGINLSGQYEFVPADPFLASWKKKKPAPC